MKTFHVKFSREFDVEIQAGDTTAAGIIARNIAGQFPRGTCKVLSVIVHGYVEKPCADCQADDPAKPPGGRPNGGGSPGTPVVRTEELVDQIAKVA